MTDWLRLLLMLFYAPLRGMREVRDRGSLAPAAFIAFVAEAGYTLLTDRFFGSGGYLAIGRPLSALFHAAVTVVVVAIVMVPILTLVANTFERRGSFRVVITQEYAPVAATMFYVLAAVNVYSLLAAVVFQYSGLQASLSAAMAAQLEITIRETPRLAEQLSNNPAAASAHLPFAMFKMTLFFFGSVFGVRDVFRTSAVRAVFICILAGFGTAFFGPVIQALFYGVLGSPFLLILAFSLLLHACDPDRHARDPSNRVLPDLMDGVRETARAQRARLQTGSRRCKLPRLRARSRIASVHGPW